MSNNFLQFEEVKKIVQVKAFIHTQTKGNNHLSFHNGAPVITPISLIPCGSSEWVSRLTADNSPDRAKKFLTIYGVCLDVADLPISGNEKENFTKVLVEISPCSFFFWFEIFRC